MPFRLLLDRESRDTLVFRKNFKFLSCNALKAGLACTLQALCKKYSSRLLIVINDARILLFVTQTIQEHGFIFLSCYSSSGSSLSHNFNQLFDVRCLHKFCNPFSVFKRLLFGFGKFFEIERQWTFARLIHRLSIQLQGDFR